MVGLIRRLGTKVRGIIGLGAVAGGVGVVLGAAWSVLAMRLSLGFFPDVTNGYFLSDVVFVHAVEWGVRSAVLGSGFGVVLAAVDSRPSLGELSPGRVGVYGALAGAALWGGILLERAVTTPLVFLDAALATLPAMGVLGVVGAAVSTSLVTIARVAERSELAGTREAVSLPSSD